MRTMNVLQSCQSALVHAVRTLAKERASSLVCVVSLGVGLGALVALTTLGRGITAPARGVSSDGLVELLVVPQGPLRERPAYGRWNDVVSDFASSQLTATRLQLLLPLPYGSGATPVMEPVIYAAASALEVAVALVAGLAAARRATSIDRMAAMRTE